MIKLQTITDACTYGQTLPNMLLANCAKNNLGYPNRGGLYNILFILFAFVVVVGTIDKASYVCGLFYGS